MAESNEEVDGQIKRKCRPCLNKDIDRAADIFCSTCKEFQCNDCSNVHRIYAFMKNHNVLSVNEGPTELDSKDTDVVDMNGLDICKRHKKRFKYFCKQDKTLLCSKCAIINHRRCTEVVELENIAEKSQCETLSKTLQTAMKKTNQAVENLNEAELCLIDDIQNIPDKLSKLRQNMIHIFDEFAENVTKDANTYREETIADWATRKRDCETKLETMETTLETISNIAKNGTQAQQFIRAHNMTEKVQNDIKDAEVLCADSWTLKVSCDFKGHCDTLSSKLHSALAPGAIEIKYSVPKKTKLESIAVIDIKQTGDNANEPFYTGLDFLPDGRLVVVDYENNKCLLYDEDLNLKCSYALSYVYPERVVAVSNEEVVITTGNNCRLDFLQVSKSNEITLNRTIDVNGKYFSITMMNDENFVVGTSDHDKPVRIVSMSGEEKYFDIDFLAETYSFDSCSSTYIRGKDKVVLTDDKAERVYIYDVNTGKKVETMDKQIKSPGDVAVGQYDHVFVCSEDKHSIVQITPSGRILSSHQVDMKYPCVIAISKDKRRLAVSNAVNAVCQLKLYKLLSE